MFVSEETRKTTKSDIWFTPKKTFDLINKEFNFTLDAATEKDNHLGLKKFYTKEDDSLTKDWSKEVTWLNPPSQCVKSLVRKLLKSLKKVELL